MGKDAGPGLTGTEQRERDTAQKGVGGALGLKRQCGGS